MLASNKTMTQRTGSSDMFRTFALIMFLICAGVHAASDAPSSQSYAEIISTLDKAMYDDDVLKTELDSLKGTISLDDLAGLRTASEATLTEADRGFVYSIRRKDQDEHHYILGTIHPEDKFYQLHLEEQLKKMIEREGIQTVYTEMDFTKEQNAKARFEEAMIAGLRRVDSRTSQDLKPRKP